MSLEVLFVRFGGLICSIVWCNWFAHFGRASFVGLVCSIVCCNWFAHFGRASFVGLVCSIVCCLHHARVCVVGS